MELWIRSQDKEALTKVNMGVMYWEDVNKRNCIVNKDNATGFSILGAYKSKERALEVLEEIQKLLMPISEYKQEVDNLIINYKNIDTTIYEMPEE